MIERIQGTLEGVTEDSAILQPLGGVSVRLLVTGYTTSRLGAQVGQSLAMHTFFWLEQQAQGATMIPRLAGFERVEDRAFFELFTACKGLGYRRALRAMAMSTEQIATAIADKDADLIKSLPEIGKRTAETIIATLNGRVERFATNVSFAAAPVGNGKSKTATESDPKLAMNREALEVLLRLGEQRTQAIAWINEAHQQGEPPADVQELLGRVYAIKDR